MTKAKLSPLKIYPDSSETYHLENLLKTKNVIANLDLTSKQIRDVRKAIVLLRKIRKHEPVRRPLRRTIKFRVDMLAKQILATQNIKIHQRNKLLTSRVVEISSKKRKRIKIKYKLTDVILYLLYALPDAPINGRISITKQVFLAIKEILREEHTERANYIPYKFGPYSFLVTQIISNLQYDGLINVSGRKNSSSEKFFINENGKKAIKKKFNLLPKKIREDLIDRRKGWDEDHTDGILSYVYDRYPEYTEKSKIKKRYKSISWGRAKG